MDEVRDFRVNHRIVLNIIAWIRQLQGADTVLSGQDTATHLMVLSVDYATDELIGKTIRQ